MSVGVHRATTERAGWPTGCNQGLGVFAERKGLTAFEQPQKQGMLDKVREIPGVKAVAIVHAVIQ